MEVTSGLLLFVLLMWVFGRMLGSGIGPQFAGSPFERLSRSWARGRAKGSREGGR